MFLNNLTTDFIVSRDTIGEKRPGFGGLPRFLARADWVDMRRLFDYFLHDRPQIRFKLELMLLERLENGIKVLGWK